MEKEIFVLINLINILMATWPTIANTPAASDKASEIDDRVRELRGAISERAEKGHTWGGSATVDGGHINGAPIAYYESSDPTNRADGTALTAVDSDGLLLVDSDDNSLKIYSDDDSAFKYVTGSMGLLYLLKDEKTSGTDGGTCTAGSWQKRTLNTEAVSQINGASLSSSQITLPAGTYYVDFIVPGYAIAVFQGRLRNVDDNTTVVLGMTRYSYVSNPEPALARGRGQFTISASKTFELQQRSSATKADTGFGKACSFGTEVYSQIGIWLIA